MSSTESSGAPAEATATTPASNAAPSFGSTRGSGLARGKAKRPSASAATNAAPSDYTPTAIEVVTAPREYQNPFAPVETPAAVTESVAPAAPAPVAPAPVAPVKSYTAPAPEVAVSSSAVGSAKAEAPVEHDQPAELNILEPEQQKTAPAQTWESEGFRPAREPRADRPRREESRRDEPRHEERTERAPRQESAPSAPFDPSSIPEKFLYVRPGYNYVPTPSNYGGAPREPREQRPASSESYSAPAAAAPAKSGGGFFGWLKSLFGGSSSPAAAPVEARNGGEHRHGGDRHRGGGGRGRGQGGGDSSRRRSRGGRGRSSSGGQYRSDGARGGDSTG